MDNDHPIVTGICAPVTLSLAEWNIIALHLQRGAYVDVSGVLEKLMEQLQEPIQLAQAQQAAAAAGAAH